jgi:hypothetical protein
VQVGFMRFVVAPCLPLLQDIAPVVGQQAAQHFAANMQFWQQCIAEAAACNAAASPQELATKAVRAELRAVGCAAEQLLMQLLLRGAVEAAGL